MESCVSVCDVLVEILHWHPHDRMLSRKYLEPRCSLGCPNPYHTSDGRADDHPRLLQSLSDPKVVQKKLEYIALPRGLVGLKAEGF